MPFQSTSENQEEITTVTEIAADGSVRTYDNDPPTDDNCLPPPLEESDGIVVGEEVYEEINFEDVNFDTFLVPTEPLPSEQNYSSTYLREINVFNLSSFFRYRGYQNDLVITTDQGEKRIQREEFRTQTNVSWLASHVANITMTILPNLGAQREETPADLYRIQNKYFRVLEGSEAAPIQDLWARNLIPEEEISEYYETISSGGSIVVGRTDGYPKLRRNYEIKFTDGLERTPEQSTAFFNSLFRPGLMYEDNCFTVPQPVEERDLVNLNPIVAYDCYVINFSSSVGVRNIPFDDNLSEPNMPNLYLDYYNHERSLLTGLSSNNSICEQNLVVQKFLASNQDMMNRANESAIVQSRHNTHISIEIKRPSCMTTSFNDFGQLILDNFKEFETDKYYLNTQHLESNHKFVQKILIEDDMVPINNVAPNDRFSISSLKTTQFDALSYASNLAEHSSTREEQTRMAYSLKHHYPLKFSDYYDEEQLVSNDLLRIADFSTQAASVLKDRMDYTYDHLRQGNTHSQSIIGYKIEKYVAGDETLPIQTIYLTEAYSLDGSLKFIDSQVKYGSTYKYKIYSIVLHTGIKYSYSLEQQGQASEQNNIPYKVTYRKYSRITEVPFYQKTISLADLPPLSPSVTFYPDKTDPTKLGIIFNHSVGEKIERPIGVSSVDQDVIDRMLLNQTPTEDGKIRYYSDSLPTEYELFISTDRPFSYLDMAGKSVRNIATDKRTSTFLELHSIIPNRTYWFMFRSREDSGISNPSLIYQYRMITSQNGNYFTLSEYDLYKGTPETRNDCFQRALKIEPSPVQKYVNFGPSPQIDSRDFSITAPELADVNIGDSSLPTSIWDKDYKFRISSKMTGRKIDLNVNFGQKRTERTDQQQNDTTMCDPPLRPEDNPEPEDPQNIECLKQIEMPALTYEVKHEKECKTPDGLEKIKKFEANWAINWNTPDGYFNMNPGSGGTGVPTEHEEIFQDLIPGGLNPDGRALDTRIENWLKKMLFAMHGDDLGGCRCSEDPSMIYDFVPPGPHKQALDNDGAGMFWPVYGSGDKTYSQSSILYPTSIPQEYRAEFGSYSWHDWFSLRQQWWTQFVGMTPEQAIHQALSLHRRAANEFGEASPREKLMATAMWNPSYGSEHEQVLRCLVNVQNLLHQAALPLFDDPRGTAIAPSAGTTRVSFFYKSLYHWGFLNSNFSNPAMNMDWICPQEKREEEIKEEPPPEDPPEMPSGCDVTIDASSEEHDVCPGEEFTINPDLILDCAKNPYGTADDIQIVLAAPGIGTLNCVPTIEGNTIKITVPEGESTAHFTFLLLVSANGAEYQTDYYKFEIINIADCNEPPVANDFTVDGSSFNPGDTIAVAIPDILAVCSDPDGDTLAIHGVYSAASSVNLSSVSITDTHINLVVTDPGNAETRFNVRDTHGATSNYAKLKVTNVQEPNNPPVAGDFSISVPENNGIAFFINQATGNGTTGGAPDTLLRNSSDPDGDVLTVVSPLVEGSPHVGLSYEGVGLNGAKSMYALTVDGFFESTTVPKVTFSIADPSGDTSSGEISIVGGFIRKAYEIPTEFSIDVSGLNKTMGDQVEFKLSNYTGNFLSVMDPQHNLNTEGLDGGSAVEHKLSSVMKVQNCSSANFLNNEYFSAFNNTYQDGGQNKLHFRVYTEQVQNQDPVVKIKFKIKSRLIQSATNPVYAASTTVQKAKTLESNFCTLTITGMKPYVPPPPTCGCKEKLDPQTNQCVPKSPYVAGADGNPVLPAAPTGYRWQISDDGCDVKKVAICDKGTYDPSTGKCMTESTYYIEFLATCPEGKDRVTKSGFEEKFVHEVSIRHPVGAAPSQNVVDSQWKATIRDSQDYKAWLDKFDCVTPEVPCPGIKIKDENGACKCPAGYTTVGDNCIRYRLEEEVRETYIPKYRIRAVMMMKLDPGVNGKKAWRFFKNNLYAQHQCQSPHPASKDRNNPFDYLLSYGFAASFRPDLMHEQVWQGLQGTHGHLAEGFDFSKWKGIFNAGSTISTNSMRYGLDRSWMVSKKFNYQHGKPDYIETHISDMSALYGRDNTGFASFAGNNMTDFTHRPHFASALSTMMQKNSDNYYSFKTHETVLQENNALGGIEGANLRGETGWLTKTAWYGDEYGSDGNLNPNVWQTYNELDRKYGQLDNEYSMFQFTRIYTYSPSEDFIFAADYLRRETNQVADLEEGQPNYLKPSRLTQAEFDAVMRRTMGNNGTYNTQNQTQRGNAEFRNRSTHYRNIALTELESGTYYDGRTGLAGYDTLQYDRYQAKENYQGRYRDGFWFKQAQDKWNNIHDYVRMDQAADYITNQVQTDYGDADAVDMDAAVLEDVPKWPSETEASDPIKYGCVIEKIINNRVTDVFYITEHCPWKPRQNAKRNGKRNDRWPRAGGTAMVGEEDMPMKYNGHQLAGATRISVATPASMASNRFLPYRANTNRDERYHWFQAKNRNDNEKQNIVREIFDCTEHYDSGDKPGASARLLTAGEVQNLETNFQAFQSQDSSGDASFASIGDFYNHFTDNGNMNVISGVWTSNQVRETYNSYVTEYIRVERVQILEYPI